MRFFGRVRQLKEISGKLGKANALLLTSRNIAVIRRALNERKALVRAWNARRFWFQKEKL